MPISNPSKPSVPDGLNVDDLRLGEARMAFFSYLEGFYPVRRHSALGCRSPLVYEQEHRPKPATEILLSKAP